MQSEQAINSGNFPILKPGKALNKAFLKVKPNRSEIEQFILKPKGIQFLILIMVLVLSFFILGTIFSDWEHFKDGLF